MNKQIHPMLIDAFCNLAIVTGSTAKVKLPKAIYDALIAEGHIEADGEFRCSLSEGDRTKVYMGIRIEQEPEFIDCCHCSDSIVKGNEWNITSGEYKGEVMCDECYRYVFNK